MAYDLALTLNRIRTLAMTLTLSKAMAHDLARVESEAAACKEDDYSLPDGTKLNAGAAKTHAVESIFSPAGERQSLPDLVCGVVQAAHADIRHDLVKNMVLAGASSRFRGLNARLLFELRSRFPDAYDPNLIYNDKEADIQAWQGGSLLAALSTSSRGFVTREKYQDEGAARCCFFSC